MIKAIGEAKLDPRMLASIEAIKLRSDVKELKRLLTPKMIELLIQEYVKDTQEKT